MPMRILRMLAIVALAYLLPSASASALEIPDFTPNVVDPGGYLDEAGKQRVDAELQRIREAHHIWGAVFIVATLDGQPIENVAVEAFEKWQLGQKGVDNGLLLVLAINDRKSRFEVGYGLEGSIPDVVARHALDDHLAPKMREGDTAGAIVASFEFLSRIVAKDPYAIRELDQGGVEEEFDGTRGSIAWGALVLAIWLCVPLRNRWVQRQRERLQKRDPTLSLDDEEIVRSEGGGMHWKASLGIQGFLSINPGIFVFLLSAVYAEAAYISMAASLLILGLTIALSGRRYVSPEHYRKFLDRIARERVEMLEKGHLKETAPGVYAYTPAYHASRSSSSSSSSSRSSSSSGGGRSGGGGSSSSW